MNAENLNRGRLEKEHEGRLANEAALEKEEAEMRKQEQAEKDLRALPYMGNPCGISEQCALTSRHRSQEKPAAIRSMQRVLDEISLWKVANRLVDLLRLFEAGFNYSTLLGLSESTSAIAAEARSIMTAEDMAEWSHIEVMVKLVRLSVLIREYVSSPAATLGEPGRDFESEAFDQCQEGELGLYAKAKALKSERRNVWDSSRDRWQRKKTVDPVSNVGSKYNIQMKSIALRRKESALTGLQSIGQSCLCRE